MEYTDIMTPLKEVDPEDTIYNELLKALLLKLNLKLHQVLSKKFPNVDVVVNSKSLYVAYKGLSRALIYCYVTKCKEKKTVEENFTLDDNVLFFSTNRGEEYYNYIVVVSPDIKEAENIPNADSAIMAGLRLRDQIPAWLCDPDETHYLYRMLEEVGKTTINMKKTFMSSGTIRRSIEFAMNILNFFLPKLEEDGYKTEYNFEENGNCKIGPISFNILKEEAVTEDDYIMDSLPDCGIGFVKLPKFIATVFYKAKGKLWVVYINITSMPYKLREKLNYTNSTFLPAEYNTVLDSQIKREDKERHNKMTSNFMAQCKKLFDVACLLIDDLLKNGEIHVMAFVQKPTKPKPESERSEEFDKLYEVMSEQPGTSGKTVLDEGIIKEVQRNHDWRKSFFKKGD